MFALYKKGDAHVVPVEIDGEIKKVRCEIVRVDLMELDDYRKSGWVDDIMKIYEGSAKASTK